MGGGANVNVYDPMPSISSISNQPWSKGTTTSFTISGSGFGTNPSLTISGSGINSYGISSSGDNYINANVTIDPSAPDETVTVTITSNGYNGSPFIGQSGQSNNGSANVNVASVAAPAPQIPFNGSGDITGTTQSVLIGQQIGLSSSVNVPAGMAISSQSWTIPGTTVAGFTADDNNGQVVQLLTFTNSAMPYFFWVLQARYRCSIRDIGDAIPKV